ncbi:MerR family transcriptional regulator [Wukongibacter baidiensis]|uniref:MerR family transcriptional regulator n=1 Tax=Wukongibacter baidiensis TaxID=1723361 RepID=UPI003D7F9246
MKFSIGEMAKMHNISTQTLRYYDKIGLLKPKKIDKNNKYRYYSIDQFEKLQTIKYLKYLGMSLNDIKDHLEKKDINNILNMLENQKEIVEIKIKEYTSIKDKIDTKIEIIRNYINTQSYDDIEIKELPKRKIAAINTNDELVPDEEFFLYINQLQNLYKKGSLLFAGDIGVIISKESLKNNIFDKFKALYFFVEDSASTKSKSIRVLPANKYACIYHRGLLSETYKTYKKLFKYLDENNYTITGDAVEISLIDTSVIASEEEFFLEIQVPIK